MLQITYPALSYGKQKIIQAGTLTITSAQPMLIQGNEAGCKAFFDALKADRGVEFIQGTKLNRSLMLQNICEIIPEISLPKHMRISHLLKKIPALTLSQLNHDLHLRLESWMRVRDLTEEQRTITALYLTWKGGAHIFLLNGKWDACSEALQMQIRTLMHRIMEDGAYVLMTSGASNVLTPSEIWNIEQSPPPAQSSYLDEALPFTRPLFHPAVCRHAHPLRMISTLCYVILVSLAVIYATHYGLYLYENEILQNRTVEQLKSEPYQELQLYSVPEYQLYDDFYYGQGIPFDEKQKKEIQRFSDEAGAELYFEKDMRVILSGRQEETAIIQDGKRVPLANTENYSPSMTSIVEASTYDLDAMVRRTGSEAHQHDGIYVASYLAPDLTDRLEGAVLSTTVMIPLYHWIEEPNAENGQGYEPSDYHTLSVELQVELPINGVTQDWGAASSILIEDGMYEELVKQAQASYTEQHGENLIEYHGDVMTPYWNEEELMPYSESKAHIYAKTREQILQIDEQLKQKTELHIKTVDRVGLEEDSFEQTVMAYQGRKKIVTPLIQILILLAIGSLILYIMMHKHNEQAIRRNVMIKQMVKLGIAMLVCTTCILLVVSDLNVFARLTDPIWNYIYTQSYYTFSSSMEIISEYINFLYIPKLFQIMALIYIEVIVCAILPVLIIQYCNRFQKTEKQRRPQI